jgi:hypothetical protein
MKTKDKKLMPKFSLGKTVLTRGINEMIREDQPSADFLGICLMRHERGDWGEICEEDYEENERALKSGYRLMSVYPYKGEKIWIITEWDRSVTTILKPSEY